VIIISSFEIQHSKFGLNKMLVDPIELDFFFFLSSQTFGKDPV